jgi:hypothetical protein
MSEAPVFLMDVPNEPLAQYWADVLEDAGIPVMVRAQGPGFGGWGSAALLPHDLYVRAADLERARAVVAADAVDETISEDGGGAGE